MKATLPLTTLALLLACAPASADYFSAQADDGVRSYSDRPLASTARSTRVAGNEVEVPARSELTGLWTAEGDNGRYVNFSIEESGKYIFDQRNHDTPARLYMCGRLQTTDDSLELSVVARKEMQATGETTEVRNAGMLEFEVVSVRSDRIVLDIEGTKLVFFRG
ncbi:MAG: DUF4124 domain-containing protein [Pseudomonadota bacterium]